LICGSTKDSIVPYGTLTNGTERSVRTERSVPYFVSYPGLTKNKIDKT